MNKAAFKAKYNPEDPATSDIDMAMQELLLNRGNLTAGILLHQATMDTNDGYAEPRSVHESIQYAMMNKWGAVLRL